MLRGSLFGRGRDEGSRALQQLLEQAQEDLTEAREELDSFKAKHKLEMTAAEKREVQRKARGLKLRLISSN